MHCNQLSVSMLLAMGTLQEAAFSSIRLRHYLINLIKDQDPAVLDFCSLVSNPGL